MDVPGSTGWRAARRTDLLAFAARSRRPQGFGRLAADGTVQERGLELWINARMTYVFALAAIDGVDGAHELAAHGVEALRTVLHDDACGGWFAEFDLDGRPLPGPKGCYEHAFVLLAAGAAAGAGLAHGDGLLRDAAAMHQSHFWDETAGRCVDACSVDWTAVSDYRGANANMHSVEAYLVAADVTGDSVWRQRALSISTFLVDGQARAHDWRLPEHYDAAWRPDLEAGADAPADPFRPYGATPGHALEWSRLLLTLEAALADRAPDWLLEAAVALFDRAVADAVSDVPGLPYTTDWDGRVVVAERFHWVMAEAVLAADALARRTGEARFADLRHRWWDEVATRFVVPTGTWVHELDASATRPTGTTWPDAPDAYHAFNALTLPDLPLAPTAPLALRLRAREATA